MAKGDEWAMLSDGKRMGFCKRWKLAKRGFLAGN
jgi:hypothetical protein